MPFSIFKVVRRRGRRLGLPGRRKKTENHNKALGDNDDDAEWKTSRRFRRDGQRGAARQKSFHERHTKIKYPN